MTGYGTIPAPSSSPVNLEYISRAKERIKAGLGTRRPWREMLSIRSLGLPRSFRDTVVRVRTNIAHFRMNYVIVVLTVVFLSLLWYPMSLVVFAAMLAVWTFLYFLRDEPLVVFGRLITDRVVVLVLSAVTIIALLLTHATKNVLVSLLIGAAVVLIHGALRRTDDLSADEEAGGGLVRPPAS